MDGAGDVDDEMAEWIIDDIGGGIMQDDPPERERAVLSGRDGFVKEMGTRISASICKVILSNFPSY